MDRERLRQTQGAAEKAAERTIDGLWRAIKCLIHLFTPQEFTNYFEAAGYDAA